MVTSEIRWNPVALTCRVWRIAEQVLLAQLIGDLLIDGIEILLLFRFKKAAAGFIRDLLHDLLAIHVRFARRLLPTAATAAGVPHAAASRVPHAAASRIAHAPAPSAPTLSRVTIAETRVRLLTLEVNRVHLGFGLLRCFHRFSERFLAAAIFAIAQNNDGFTPGLFREQIVRRKIDRVIELRASTAMVTVTAAVVVFGRWPELVQRLAQLRLGRGQIFEKLDFAVEVQHGGFIFRLGEHVIKKALARRAFGVERIAHAAAGVHVQGQGERQVRVQVEVADRLRPGILGEHEIILGQPGNDLALLIPDNNRQGHEPGVH